ncbi:MAG: NYN domain-containing protein [Candidatus Lokiarchaeota archaeon]|nr:NYN domain-containing protein [Candidatus Lokiarchaeota archaeon]
MNDDSPLVDALLGSGEKREFLKSEPQSPGLNRLPPPRIDKQDAPPGAEPTIHVPQERPQGFEGTRGASSVGYRRPPSHHEPPTGSQREPEQGPGIRAAPPAEAQASADVAKARLDEVERQFKENLVAQVENIVARQFSGPVRQKLVADISASLEGGVIREVIKRFNMHFSAQVKDLVKAEVKAELKAEVGKELRDEFQKEIVEARQVTSRLSGAHDNLRKLVGEDVKKAILDELRGEFSGLLGQARHAGAVIKDNIDPLKKQIKNELKSDIEQKIRGDLPSLFKQEIKDELVREISDEIGNPIKRDLSAEISEAVEEDVKEHLRRYMKRQARLAVMNAGSEHPVHLVVIDFNNLWAIANKVTTRHPNIKHLFLVLRSVLKGYDDHFVPQRVSGYVYASKYHEVDVNRALSMQFQDDPELEQVLKQFTLEVQADKKMQADGQDQKYRDVDVMMATKATALFSNKANQVASITIVSGDGDFVPVIDAAKHLGIYTIVFSFKENLATTLKFKADTFRLLNKPAKYDA